MEILPPRLEVTPGKIDPENLRNELKFLGPGAYTPINAIAMLCEVAGFTEKQINEWFPDLKKFSGNVKVSVSPANQPPVVISILDAPTKEQLNAGHHAQLWYAYDVTNDRAADLIEVMPGHPRNLSDAERAMDPQKLREQQKSMTPKELTAHQARNRLERTLKNSWAKPQAPIGDSDTANRFLNKAA